MTITIFIFFEFFFYFCEDFSAFFTYFLADFSYFWDYFRGKNNFSQTFSKKGLVLEKNEFVFYYTFRKIGGVRPECNKCYTFLK